MPSKFLKHASSICCPLTFYREYTKKTTKEQHATTQHSYNAPRSHGGQMHEELSTTKCKALLHESLAIALLFMLGEFYQVSNSTTRASPCHASTLLSYPSGLVCHEKNIKQKNKIKSKHKIKQIYAFSNTCSIKV